MTPEVILSTIGAILTALAIHHFGSGLLAWFTGVQKQQSDRMTALVTEASESDARADGEAEDRRRLQEHATFLRAKLIECGILPETLPEMPAIGAWRKVDHDG